MANLYLKCKQCSRQFFSGVDSPPPEARSHECMFCHQSPVYELEDYIAGYNGEEAEAMAPHG